MVEAEDSPCVSDLGLDIYSKSITAKTTSGEVGVEAERETRDARDIDLSGSTD